MINNTPYFIENSSKEYVKRKSLEDKICTDVLVVGGGMSGLSVAYNLSKKINPRKIILIERNRIGFGTTGFSSGLLTDSIEEDYFCMEYGVNMEIKSGVDEIVKVTKEERLDCRLKKVPSLYFCNNYSQSKNIQKEYESRKKDGFDVDLLNKDHLSNLYGINAELAMINKEGYCLDPVRFCQELAKRLENKGVRIYESTRLINYESGEKRAFTQNGCLDYGTLVLTNDSPKLEKTPLFGKTFLLSSSVGVTKPLTRKQYQELWRNGEAMGWNGEDFSYFYFRPVDDRLLIGGVDKLISLRDSRRNRYYNLNNLVKLKELLKETFPTLKSISFDNFWTGIIPESIDSLPFVGEIKQDHYIGLHNPGLPLAYKSGELISKLINKETPNSFNYYRYDRPLSLDLRFRSLVKYQPFTLIANKIIFSLLKLSLKQSPNITKL